MLTTFIMTMRGTPYYYNGDELGMTNAGFASIEDYKDMPTLNEYRHQKAIGGDLNKFMQRIKFESRDNGRTPFPWDNTSHAGFTTGTPWLKVNSNYKDINYIIQDKNTESVLNYFRKVVKLRKENKALIYGKYTLLDRNNTKVYAYTREYVGQKILVVLNFSSTNAAVNTGYNMVDAKVLLSNYSTLKANKYSTGQILLKPYEAIIFQL